MSLSAPIELLQSVYDEELGFRPLNFSIKPVHVANGMARALTARSYDTDALSKTLRRYVVNQKLGVDQERNPNDQILERFGEAFESLRPGGGTVDSQRLNRLRSLSLDVLGADDAVFEQSDKSSYTLSNERFVTKDPSDQRAGLFLARLLTSDHGDGSDAADLLLELLSTETDAWTTLALPLLGFGEVRSEKEEGQAAERAAKARHLFAKREGRMKSATLGTLRDSMDRLARFERTAGSKLNSMRRLVLFGCFALHIHAISRWHEQSGGTAPRPPILLDMFDGTVVTLRDASRATLRAAGDAVEGLVLDRFKEYVAAEVGKTDKTISPAVNADGVDEELARDFDNLRAGGRGPVESLAQALVDASLSKAREHPIGALVELGRRAGFLSPWANSGRGGKLRKRYTATSEFLEILIVATVEPDEPLEFPEFLDRLKEDFGIVIGRPEDDDVLRLNNLHGDQFGAPTTLNEDDLRSNVTELRKSVIETGYGKSYADGSTVVTTAPEVLA